MARNFGSIPSNEAGWPDGVPGGGSTPSGTGWVHVTAGVQDAAASTPTASDVGADASGAATGAVSTHAGLTTGVHGLAITAGQTLTVTSGGTLGTAAYTAATAYDASGAAASAQAAAIAASLPLHGKADTAGAADTAVTLATGADRTKLDGIAAGAEVNVNADWNAVAGDALIQNKPTITGSNTGDQTGGTPAITLSTVNTAGSSPNFLRRDDTILAFDATAPSTQAFSDSAVVGSATVAARRDHKHAMMAAPTTITGNAGTATKLAATKNINGVAFDGSADINAVPTWKCGQTTRDISTASGAQNIAHGLGRVPQFVRILGRLAFSAGISMECNSVYDGTTQSGSAVIWSEGTSTAVADTIYQSTAAAVGFSNAAAVNPFTGATKASGVITVDATNIIITWTKTGTPTGTAQLAWECT